MEFITVFFLGLFFIIIFYVVWYYLQPNKTYKVEINLTSISKMRILYKEYIGSILKISDSMN